MSEINEQLVQLHEQLATADDWLSELDLAIRLSCSPQKIVQLVDQLQSQWHAPIEKNSYPRQYRYTAEFDIPIRILAASDWQQIVTVINVLGDLNRRHQSLGFKTVQQTLHRLLEQHNVDPDHVTRRVKVIGRQYRPLDSHIVEPIADSVFKRKRSLLKYSSAHQELTDREVSPQRLILYREQWYLDAWCHQRNAMRTFALARINSVLVLPQGALELSDDELDIHSHRQYGLLSGDTSKIAEILFYQSAATRVSQQQWHPQAEGHWRDGAYYLRLPYVSDGELLGDLLAMAPDVKVLQPLELRQRFVERLQLALQRQDLPAADEA